MWEGASSFFAAVQECRRLGSKIYLAPIPVGAAAPSRSRDYGHCPRTESSRNSEAGQMLFGIGSHEGALVAK